MVTHGELLALLAGGGAAAHAHPRCMCCRCCCSCYFCCCCCCCRQGTLITAAEPQPPRRQSRCRQRLCRPLLCTAAAMAARVSGSAHTHTHPSCLHQLRMCMCMCSMPHPNASADTVLLHPTLRIAETVRPVAHRRIVTGSATLTSRCCSPTASSRGTPAAPDGYLFSAAPCRRRRAQRGRCAVGIRAGQAVAQPSFQPQLAPCCALLTPIAPHAVLSSSRRSWAPGDLVAAAAPAPPRGAGGRAAQAQVAALRAGGAVARRRHGGRRHAAAHPHHGRPAAAGGPSAAGRTVALQTRLRAALRCAPLACTPDHCDSVFVASLPHSLYSLL